MMLYFVAVPDLLSRRSLKIAGRKKDISGSSEDQRTEDKLLRYLGMGLQKRGRKKVVLEKSGGEMIWLKRHG
jgi:hypothetical protein